MLSTEHDTTVTADKRTSFLVFDDVSSCQVFPSPSWERSHFVQVKQLIQRLSFVIPSNYLKTRAYKWR